MSPAFSSLRQLGAFILLLLLVLLLPVLLDKSMLPQREQIYGWTGWDSTGPHPYHHRLIFEEKGDIDVLFIGSSRIFHAIDTVRVQEELGKNLGRPAVVRTMGWGGAGFDALYFMTKDLLRHRKVRMLVFYDECQMLDQPNSLAPDWFRLADDGQVLTGLPWHRQAAYYFAAILGVPKNVLCLVRHNLPPDLTAEKMKAVAEMYHADDIATKLGSMTAYDGFSDNASYSGYAPFAAYTPPTTGKSTQVAVYASGTKAKFEFSGSPVPAWQLHFGRKFTKLARQEGVKLVLLHLPTTDDMKSTVINEREFWPEVLQGDVALVGIAPAVFFGGMTAEEARLLYRDHVHFNKNGQSYFTSLMLPILLKLYDDETSR